MRGTRQKKEKIKVGRWILIICCVALAFVLLWKGAAVVENLIHYGEEATVHPSKTPEEETESADEKRTADEKEQNALPLNTYRSEEFYEDDGFIRYNDPNPGQVGIDVSSHQQDIDWQAVAEAGVDFAMISAGFRGYTQGEIREDPYFRKNLSEAVHAGLDVGVYFFSQAISAEEAKEEAEFVLELLDGDALEYPVVFDWEPIEAEARTDQMNMLLLTECAEAFCSTVEAGGYRAGIYFNQEFGYQQFNLLSLKDYVFWLAEYSTAPTFAYAFQIWQYSCTGKVDGIEGNVDLNWSRFLS